LTGTIVAFILDWNRARQTYRPPKTGENNGRVIKLKAKELPYNAEIENDT